VLSDTPGSGPITGLIAERTALERSQVIALLSQLWPRLQIMHAEPPAATDALLQARPAFALLAAELPGPGGIELARRCAPVTRSIVIADKRETAADALDAGAIDFVQRPLEAARLAQALNRVREAIELQNSVAKLRWIPVSQSGTTRLFWVEQVMLLASDQKYTRVVTRQAEGLIRRSLNQIEPALDVRQFVRISRGQIVNLAWVDRIERRDGRIVLILQEPGGAWLVNRNDAMLRGW
jgi:DNA-binding LytR/AlgR family response regulator